MAAMMDQFPEIELPSGLSLDEMLGTIHEEIREVLPAITRVAFALYDPKTDRLKTFAHSSPEGNPLPHYEATLGRIPSLAALAQDRQTRILGDLSATTAEEQPHTRKIRQARYLSSYTKPVFDGEKLVGFLFFDAMVRDYFRPAVLRKLQVFVQLITMSVILSLSSVRVLKSAVQLASGLSRFRDEETGTHMERMSRYARVIAKAVAAERGLSDEFVEYVFMFAPLHDVGKIAVPDEVLFKPGRLTEEEWRIMARHVVTGARIIDRMVSTFGIADRSRIELLRNIVLYHHEAFDGSGYVAGLKGEDIPIEARIVAVADVFDALTSDRPYKKAWDNDQAFRFLAEQAGRKLDPSCVKALAEHRSQVETIRERFGSAAEEDVGFREGYFDWM